MHEQFMKLITRSKKERHKQNRNILRVRKKTSPRKCNNVCPPSFVG